MIKLECKGCQKRYPGCHAKCENYIAWNKEHQEIKRIGRIEAQKARWQTEDYYKWMNSGRRRKGR